jgi:trigger factor
LEITREQTGKLTANIHLHLDPTDYKPQVDAELKKQAKQAKMPGFRPGKVPVGVIRRMVGRSVVIETLNEVVNSALTEYLRKEELRLLGNPMPKDTKEEKDFPPEADKPLDFHFEVGLSPEIQLDFNLPDRPLRYDVEVDDAYLDKEIEQYRERFGGVTQPDSVAEGDIFYGKLHEVDAEGSPVEGGFEQLVPFNPIRIAKPEFFAPFYGAAIDSTHPVELKAVSENPKELSTLLFVDEEDVPALMDKKLHLTVKRINRMGKAELDAAFFGRMAEELGWDTTETPVEEMDEATFREKMRESFSVPAKEPARWDYLGALREKLLAHHAVELPDEFLKQWLQQNGEKPKSAEEVEGDYPGFVESQTWSLIVDEILSKNPDLQIKEDELRDQMLMDLRGMLANMGQPLAPEQEMQYLQMMAENQEMVNQSYSRLLNERVFDYLEVQIPPTEMTPITATEYFAMKEKEREEKEQGSVDQVMKQVQQAAADDKKRSEGSEG